MMITIGDILKESPFKQYDLLAGHTGITNEVRHVSVFETGPEQNDDVSPRTKVFYLTSLYYQRNDAQSMIQYLQRIDQFKASGLCVIDDYITEFPNEVIGFCNARAIPLLLVDHDIPYADMISAVMELLILSQQKKIAENKLKALENSSLNSIEVKEVLKDLNPLFKPQVTVLYTTPSTGSAWKGTTVDPFIDSVNDTSVNFACEYKRGILIILSHNEISARRYQKMLDTALKTIDQLLPQAKTGVSNDLLLSETGQAVSQAITCVQIHQNDGANQHIFYQNLGLLRLLASFLGNKELDCFYNETIQLVLDYDLQFHTHLFETLQSFIKDNCSYTAAAKDLAVHENTIRYRIDKIRELLGFSDSSMEMFHTLDVALKIHVLKHTL